MIPLVPAMACWALAWIVGSGVLAAIAIAAVGGDLDGDLTIGQLSVAAVVGWVSFLFALSVVSRRYGSGSFGADYAWGFRPVDLVGIPIGIVTQLALVPLLYLPLRAVWPDTFDSERLEERARDLADQAEGWSVVVLVLVVVVGAPIVEELVYRGMLQRSIAAASSPIVGLVVASIWFSLIHLAPVEYPGLALAGVVFGVSLLFTDRLGPAIVTHAAFNATGLAMVLA